MKLLYWVAGILLIAILTETMPKAAGWMLLLIVLVILLQYH